ncbi:hypothetical protein RhiirB3_527126 [Rhizophagus irregularis]|nr:hypothetical protein RhiirB3_527126 [Rhizophagus irregularis]
MACSKIFSGELPELLNKIIQYFRNDYSTLHSCILVNRLWCRLTIPILWENPFYPFLPQNLKNYHYIEVYLYNLNDNDKRRLNEYGINLPLNSLFNYPSFIRHLDIRSICECIKNWVFAESSYIFTNFDDILNFINKSLIKLFNEKEAKLHTLNVTYKHYFFDIIIYELVLQNSNLICNIKNLYFEPTKYVSDNINPLLKFLNSNCDSISSIYLPNFENHHKDSNTFIELSRLINSQKNLNKILLYKGFPLSILLNSNCLNTLNIIIFCEIDFKNINILNEVFEQLNVIESIHIIDCYSLDSNFTQQIINLTKPFKLKSLIFYEKSLILKDSMELILQKSGDYLENFGLSIDPTYNYPVPQLFNSNLQLIKLITSYCTKIKFFKLQGFNDQDIYLTFNLIETFKQNLNCLTIDINYLGFGFSNRHIELSSTVLQNLGQILPFKLEYLNLSLVLNTNDFVLFLKNSQNTFIKELLLNNIVNGTRKKVGQDNTLYNIKEYIMKKKRVKYFAFQTLFTDNYSGENLFDMKDEVKEFKLHDIIVQNYYKMKLDFIEFLKEEI